MPVLPDLDSTLHHTLRKEILAVGIGIAIGLAITPILRISVSQGPVCCPKC
jgi:hypothetical protein